MKELAIKEIKLINYSTLVKSINDIDDIKLDSVSLLDVYERVDCDFDAFNGRGICVRFNGGIKLVWFESGDKVIACATLNENKKHELTIKERILDCLSDKLFMYHQFLGKVDWCNKEFSDSHKHFKNILYGKMGTNS